MKKYLLSLLVVSLSFIGFSYAITETITWTEGNPELEYTRGNYNPNSITIKQDILFNEFIINYSCSDGGLIG